MLINSATHDFQLFVDAVDAKPLEGRRRVNIPLPVHETKHPHEGPEYQDWEMSRDFMKALHDARELFNPCSIYERPHELPEHARDQLDRVRNTCCPGKPTLFQALGLYMSATHEIHRYRCSEEVREIVRVHERMHAVQHLLPDDQGLCWKDFRETHRIYKELLAQLFTYKYFEHKNRHEVCRAMDTMALSQGIAYNTYRSFSHWHQSDCVNLYGHIREYNGLPGIFDDAMVKPLKRKSQELTSGALRNFSTAPDIVPLHVLIKTSSPQSTRSVCQMRGGDMIVMPDTPAARGIKAGTIGIVIDDEGRVESRIEFRSPSGPDHQLPKHRIALITRPHSWVHRVRAQSISFEERAPSRRVGANALSHSALSAIVAAADLHEKWMGSIKEKVIDKF